VKAFSSLIQETRCTQSAIKTNVQWSHNIYNELELLSNNQPRINLIGYIVHEKGRDKGGIGKRGGLKVG
jgi:hypothetical protein